MSGADRGVDDETTEQPVVPARPAAAPPGPDAAEEPLGPPQPSTPPDPEQPKAWQPPPPVGWIQQPQQTWTPPPQQGWTPPQQPGWAAPQPDQTPPQQGWGPPQQGWGPSQQPWPSGYPGQPPYWARPEHRSSPLAVIAAVALLISGALMTLFGLLLLVIGAGGAALLEAIEPSLSNEADAIAAVILIVAVLLIVVGILEIAGAIGVLVHKSWARWLGVAMASIGLVIGFLLLIGAFAPPGGSPGDVLLAIIWLGAHGFVVAALAVASDHFQPVYPPRG